MFPYILIVLCCFHFCATQDCSTTSPSFSFTNYVHPELLDLTTAPATVIARFPVDHVLSATVDTEPIYINATVVGSELQFVTTDAFSQYEEREIQIIIIIQVSYRCTTGQRQGIYRQSLKLANNHAPRFLQEAYEAQVPLPLPKHFNLSPFLANGAGVMARDIDLINNSVRFSVSENDYIFVESHPMANDRKQFKANLLLREQVLKMPHNLELIVTATDEGVPPKSTQVIVTIEPDLSIIYDDPPEFKETFVNKTIENDLLVQLELIPGTETDGVQYILEGADSTYFTSTVWTNNSGMDLRVAKLEDVPSTKTYLNVVAVASRNGLQKTSCVILLNVPVGSVPEPPDRTVEKVLAVLHLNEMTEHRDIFPLAITHCTYIVHSQTPGEYFFIEESERTLSAKPFDREDEELFIDLDFPQFWIVLQLICPNQQTAQAKVLNRLGPMNNIDFTYDLTHLNIVVEDINDNSPMFTYPANDASFAFPSARVAHKMLPEHLLKVEATDLDVGLNAVIRYSLAPNEHFEIDPRTGVIFPLSSVLAAEERTTLEIFATDRDGAEDGNTSTMKIHVVRVSEDHLVVFTVTDMDPETFKATLREIGAREGVQIETLRNVYSVAEDESKMFVQKKSARYTITAIVYAFKEDKLMTYVEMNRIFHALPTNSTFKLSKIDELYTTRPEIVESDTTVIYPYIIVAALFGALAISMTAATFYYRSKTQQMETPDHARTSESIIVENAEELASSTPPSQSFEKVEEIAIESVDSPRSLTELIAIDEGIEHEKTPADPVPPTQHERKKSIKFNENVERIEVFDKYPEN